MRLLILQLKRIGDLVLTTPAIEAFYDWHHRFPKITLGVHESCASLLPAIPDLHGSIVFGRGRGWAPWQQLLDGSWDVCLDFTGSDRSALATFLGYAYRRSTFAWVRKARLRALAYHDFAESPVRERHTIDHYLDLVEHVAVPRPENTKPILNLNDSMRAAATEQLARAGVGGAFAVIHPGTARAEKFWLADRWAAVVDHLRASGLTPVITTGPDPLEEEHARSIASASGGTPVLSPPDLLTLTALLEKAAIVLSCDTAVVHLTSAFERPQVALFGPTNPFHWRPRHAAATVISAARPDAPLTEFQPRMAGAPMDRISTELVIRATDSLLSGAKVSGFA